MFHYHQIGSQSLWIQSIEWILLDSHVNGTLGLSKMLTPPSQFRIEVVRSSVKPQNTSNVKVGKIYNFKTSHKTFLTAEGDLLRHVPKDTGQDEQFMVEINGDKLQLRSVTRNSYITMKEDGSVVFDKDPPRSSGFYIFKSQGKIGFQGPPHGNYLCAKRDGSVVQEPHLRQFELFETIKIPKRGLIKI